MADFIKKASKAVSGAWESTWPKIERSMGLGVPRDESLNDEDPQGGADRWDMENILEAKGPGALVQFPIGKVQRGELWTRTEDMVGHHEYFRYQFGPKLKNGFQTIQLTVWWACPNLMRRILIISDLYSVKLRIKGSTLCTNILVMRDGLDVDEFPAALETGAGLAYTIDRSSWKTYMNFQGAPMEGPTLDQRLLYLVIANTQSSQQWTLEDFSKLKVDEIAKYMETISPGKIWTKPTPRAAGLRDLKIVDEENLVVVSESDSDEDIEALIKFGVDPLLEGGEKEKEKVITRASFERRVNIIDSSSADDSEALLQSRPDLENSLIGANLIDLGGSPDLSTETIPGDILEGIKQPISQVGSAKKKLYADDILWMEDGTSMSTRAIGEVLVRRMFPYAREEFVKKNLDFLLSKGRYQMMTSTTNDLNFSQRFMDVRDVANGGRDPPPPIRDFNLTKSDWTMETEWDQEENQHLDELLLSSILESSRISDEEFFLIEGKSTSKRVRLEESRVTGESMDNGDEDEEKKEDDQEKKKKKLSRRQRRKKARMEKEEEERKEQIEEEAVKEAAKPFLSKVEDGRPVVDVSTETTTDVESDNKEEKDEGGEFEEEVPESEIDESL